MKFNWGTGITIAIVLFMGYILLMVYKATSTEQHLQAENYYAQEIDYQTKIDALRLGDKFAKSVKLIQTANRTEIQLPKDFQTDNRLVNLHLLRPNDSALDLTFSVPINKPIIESQKIVKGAYKATISWIYKDKDYAIESDITIK